MNTNTSGLNITSCQSFPPLIKYKIVFLGDEGVGKSSIINRYIYDLFDDDHYKPTIGIDFISQNIFLQNKTLRLQFWDTAGQERFRSLIPNYLRGSSVVLVVYDVTSRQSFERINKWLDDVDNSLGDSIVKGILGNKIDKKDRKVEEYEGRKLAQQRNALFKQISALSGENIPQFFKQISELLVKLINNPDLLSPMKENKKQVSSSPEQKKNIILQSRDFEKANENTNSKMKPDHSSKCC